MHRAVAAAGFVAWEVIGVFTGRLHLEAEHKQMYTPKNWPLVVHSQLYTYLCTNVHAAHIFVGRYMGTPRKWIEHEVCLCVRARVFVCVSVHMHVSMHVNARVCACARVRCPTVPSAALRIQVGGPRDRLSGSCDRPVPV